MITGSDKVISKFSLNRLRRERRELGILIQFLDMEMGDKERKLDQLEKLIERKKMQLEKKANEKS